MSVATEISRIQQAKADIKSSIEAKGVTVPSAALIDDYSDYVDAIQTGGGGGTSIAESVDVSDYTGGTDFDFKWQITGVNFPSGITSIAQNSFNQFKGLASVTIPNTVRNINNGGFSGCNSLASVSIPNSVTTIGNSVFSNCTSLTSVTIPDSVTSIGTSLFLNCTGLTTVTIGNSVASIGDSDFRGCTGLTTVTIGNSVASIGYQSFKECSSLQSITVPDSITSIGDETFYNCTSLNSITINATTPPALGTSALSYTNNCPIYVPAASVDTYKAASGWSSYASRIQAIPS